MGRPSAVVLDVGETLGAEGRMWASWARVCGVEPFTFTAALGVAIASGNHRRVFELVGVDPTPHRDAFFSRFGGYRAEDLYPDAVEGIAALRAAGYRVGVAGNQRAWASPALKAAGIEADAYGSSEEWGVAKPDPAFFHRCCTAVGAAPGEVVYVGDDPVRDVTAAKQAGLRAVWLRRGPWALLGAWQAAERADATIAGLLDLPVVLAALRG